jgi:hypothetical protein
MRVPSMRDRFKAAFAGWLSGSAQAQALRTRAKPGETLRRSAADRTTSRPTRRGYPRQPVESDAVRTIALRVAPDWRQNVTTIAGIVSVLLVAAGLFYTNAANREEQQATREQLHLAQQGQVTDRLTSAVEQLGSEKLDVRLGAIYALERIMHDSAADQPMVLEILAIYVRQRIPRISPWTFVDPSSQPVHALTALPVDVLSAMTVLGRRNARYDREGQRPDLTNVNLAYADLRNVKLSRVDLSSTDLTGANLVGADLVGAGLSFAQAGGAILMGADLRDANMVEMNLRNADLSDANMLGANLVGADLHDAYLRGAQVLDEDLNRAHL